MIAVMLTVTTALMLTVSQSPAFAMGEDIGGDAQRTLWLSGGDVDRRPKRIELGSYGSEPDPYNVHAQDLAWTNWGASTATASGVFSVFRQTSGLKSVAATLTMTGLVDCAAGWRAYTTMTVSLAPVEAAPQGVPFERFRVTKATCAFGPDCGHNASHCTLRGEHGQDGLSSLDSLFDTKMWSSLMRWTGISTRQATGKGLVNLTRPLDYAKSKVDTIGLKPWVYPARLRLDQPRLCDGHLGYTRLRMELFGRGAAFDWPPSPGKVPAARLRARLLSDIARKGASHRRSIVYWGRASWRAPGQKLRGCEAAS
jgi:hypothetical protein